MVLAYQSACNNKAMRRSRKPYREIGKIQSKSSCATVPLANRVYMIATCLVCYIVLLTVYLGTIRFSRVAAASVYENGFTDILITGVFDSNNGVNEAATDFFVRICELVFSIALPFMSTFAIGMTTLSLISTVIYLTKPDTFDRIHELVCERKGFGEKGLKGLNSFRQQKGMREFVYSFCIDFKAYAYPDAIASGLQGTPSMQDFLRTIPKYIVIFGFCIIINNRALLDFIMEGGQLGASLFQRVTYDIDMVETVNNFLDEGKDYKPVIWDTKKPEGANKYKVYKIIYSKLKTRCGLTEETEDQKTTAFKQEMGAELVSYIEGMTDIDWSKEVFSANCDYMPTQQTTSVEGTKIIPVNQFVPTDTGCLYLFTRGEDKNKYNVATYKRTNYEASWSVSNSSISFDAGKITSADSNLIPEGSKVTSVTSGTFVIMVADSNGSTKKLTYAGTTNGTTLSVNPSDISGWPANGEIVSVQITGMKATVTDASNQSTIVDSLDTPTYAKQ